jgi:hypothetical protein
MQRIRSEDSLRALAAVVDFLEAFGRHLHALQDEALAGAATSSSRNGKENR